MQNSFYFRIAHASALCLGDMSAKFGENFARENGAKFDEISAFRAPDLAHIKPLERRRLSAGARLCMSLLGEILDNSKIPVIFASRYGEINRCISMFETMSDDEVISPASFSVSVLNAILAQNAIFTQNHSEISAISAICALENGVLGALARLSECEKIGVLCYFEEPNSGNLPSCEFASALFLVIERGDDVNIEISPQSSDTQDENSDIKFLCEILGGSEIYSVNDGAIKYTWRFKKRTKFHKC